MSELLANLLVEDRGLVKEVGNQFRSPARVRHDLTCWLSCTLCRLISSMTLEDYPQIVSCS